MHLKVDKCRAPEASTSLDLCPPSHSDLPNEHTVCSCRLRFSQWFSWPVLRVYRLGVRCICRRKSTVAHGDGKRPDANAAGIRHPVATARSARRRNIRRVAAGRGLVEFGRAMLDVRSVLRRRASRARSAKALADRQMPPLVLHSHGIPGPHSQASAR
jgi:hypothetical protein